MSIEKAYSLLFSSALIVFGIFVGLMLIRSIIGPRITDRIMCINVIGTMVICCIIILSGLLGEGYLLDVALIYAMISFIAVLMLATTYIPRNPTRVKFGRGVSEEIKALKASDSKTANGKSVPLHALTEKSLAGTKPEKTVGKRE